MATRNVVITQHQDEFITALVEGGRYQNASEVLRAGLRLLERHELEHAARVKALAEAAQKGWDDLANGRYEDVTHEDLDAYIVALGQGMTRERSAG